MSGQMEHLLQGSRNGGVVWVDLHDVGHHVPPSLGNGVYVGGVLRVTLSCTLLITEKQVGIAAQKIL